jgi:hypothetical protein
MKTSKSSENKNFFSCCRTYLSTLLSFNNTHCCESRVGEVVMVVQRADINSQGGSGNAESPPKGGSQNAERPLTIFVPELTSQPVSTSVELTPPPQDWRGPSKGAKFVGNKEDGSVENKRKELIELHNQLFLTSSSSSTRGLYTPASSPQPLEQKSPSLIFTRSPGQGTMFAG